MIHGSHPCEPALEPPLEPPVRDDHSRRTAAVEELVTTERTYVQGLQTLCGTFYNPVRLTPKSLLLRKSTRSDADKAKERVLSPDEVATIFGSSDTLMGFHVDLLSTLESRFAAWSPEQKIGDVFLQIAPFLKMYVTYLNNYQKALETLSECEKRNADFRVFLDRVHRDPALKGLNLIAFLILPIQRIPRYRMLLEAIAKHTPEGHPDYDDLRGALGKIIAVADQVNEQIRSAENAQRVVEVQTMMAGSYPGNLVEPHRRFLFAGELVKISRKAVQKRACFLFNDVLVYARSSAAPTKPSDPTSKKNDIALDTTVSLQFKGTIDLSTAWVRDLTDSKILTNAFQIVAQDKTYTLYGTTPKQKDDWMTALNAAIDSLVQKNPGLTNERSQVNIPPVSGVYNFFTIPIDEILDEDEPTAREDRDSATTTRLSQWSFHAGSDKSARTKTQSIVSTTGTLNKRMTTFFTLDAEIPGSSSNRKSAASFFSSLDQADAPSSAVPPRTTSPGTRMSLLLPHLPQPVPPPNNLDSVIRRSLIKTDPLPVPSTPLSATAATSSPKEGYRNRPLPTVPVKSTVPAEIEQTSLVEAKQRAAAAEAPSIGSKERCVRVEWDNKAEEDGELSISKGQVLAVINDDDKEWWQGRTMDGVVGWFPAALVVPCSSGKAADQQVVEAMYDFVGKTNDELSLVRGDIIRILWASDDHWAKGERLSDKRTGWFPTNIVALSDSDDDEI